MYDLIDRPVAELPTADRRLLAATRAWVHQLTMAGEASPAAAESLGRGSAAFDAAMRALDEGSSETLVFQRPCHPTVSETEAMWLAVWRLVRADRLGHAKGALGALADEAAVPAVLAALVRAAAKV
ncbi:hypothetical protein [Sphingomonas lenta]|uniref:Uncharacterized protein n=1 Tax=Sphingomonas lenta TaxID=1141887 RepID=A0A2A2SJN7_9SPHN|nr:hypothetical protein [Sphingomonas lenta]PAX09452.1 hypothetical protein CKY28_01475 [Sphingomonas lenta]